MGENIIVHIYTQRRQEITSKHSKKKFKISMLNEDSCQKKEI